MSRRKFFSEYNSAQRTYILLGETTDTKDKSEGKQKV
jgi:hypothetical protein